MSALTIYNHGTTVDQNQTDNLITALYHETVGSRPNGQFGDRVLVTHGVGSGLKRDQAAGLSKVKEALGVGGTVVGAGIDQNVDLAHGFVADAVRQGAVSVVNLCGYSRGAVTCFKIANQLSRKGTDAVKNLRVRIFAIDPVPGCSTFVNSHMYKHIELTENVVECKVILAENERRKTFRPVLDRKFFDPRKPETFVWDTVPGNHKGIVTASPRAGDSERIVFDMAKRFLRKPHKSLGLGGGGTTPFKDPAQMTKAEVLARYSKIMAEYRQYVRQGTWSLNPFSSRFENLVSAGPGSPTDRGGSLTGFAKDRVVRVQTESNSLRPNHNYHGAGPVLKHKTAGGGNAFFVNNDHQDRFVDLLPATHSIIRRAELGDPGQLAKLADPNSVPSREAATFFRAGTPAVVAAVEAHIRGYMNMFGVQPAW